MSHAPIRTTGNALQGSLEQERERQCGAFPGLSRSHQTSQSPPAGGTRAGGGGSRARRARPLSAASPGGTRPQCAQDRPRASSSQAHLRPRGGRPSSPAFVVRSFRGRRRLPAGRGHRQQEECLRGRLYRAVPEQECPLSLGVLSYHRTRFSLCE